MLNPGNVVAYVFIALLMAGAVASSILVSAGTALLMAYVMCMVAGVVCLIVYLAPRSDPRFRNMGAPVQALALWTLVIGVPFASVAGYAWWSQPAEAPPRSIVTILTKQAAAVALEASGVTSATQAITGAGQRAAQATRERAASVAGGAADVGHRAMDMTRNGAASVAGVTVGALEQARAGLAGPRPVPPVTEPQGPAPAAEASDARFNERLAVAMRLAITLAQIIDRAGVPGEPSAFPMLNYLGSAAGRAVGTVTGGAGALWNRVRGSGEEAADRVPGAGAAEKTTPAP